MIIQLNVKTLLYNDDVKLSSRRKTFVFVDDNNRLLLL